MIYQGQSEKYYQHFNLAESEVEKILEKEENDVRRANPQTWDDATLSQASGLLQYLNSFLFCFLVIIFNKILGQSAILYNVLQSRQTDFSFGAAKIHDFSAFLLAMRTQEEFEQVFQSAVVIVGQPSSRSDVVRILSL